MDLDFFYDVVCPYAYLASTRIEALAARTGATLRWRPVLLGGLFRAAGGADNPAAAMSAPKARLNLLDMHRYAARYGVALTMPPAHPRRSVDAMRLLVAASEVEGDSNASVGGVSTNLRPALSHALFRAYWVEGLDVADRAVLATIAARFGAPGAEAFAALDRPETKTALIEATAAGTALGLFGVPSFGVGGRFFWGQDRMHLVERALTGVSPPVSQLQTGVGVGATVTFFHDLSSPFSYLASTQFERVVGARGATGATSIRRPILVGALFRQIGTPDVPLLAMPEARRAYVARDLADWADFWGVPFRFPDTFPLRTVLPLRALLVEPAATDALYRAAWVENRDIGDAATLRAVLDGAGFDGSGIVARATDDPGLKAELRANTEAAAAAGACGVPTFLVEKPGHAPEVFWGQDRFDLVMESTCR